MDEENRKRVTAEELLKRYADGEREFADLNLEPSDDVSTIPGSLLHQAAALRANYQGAGFKREILARAHLSHADFSGANLSRAFLNGADLSHTKLCWANLSDADLAWANLMGAILCEANLKDAYLAWADLDNADLTEANLSGADLTEAELKSATLSGANLRRANLSGTNLSGADLSKADLSEADVSYAIFQLTCLADTILDGLDLSTATFSPETDLLKARWATLVFGGNTYGRQAVECGEKILPVGMGSHLDKLTEQKSDLEHRLTSMKSRIEQLESFLEVKRDVGKVFLSHAHADKAVVEKVKAGLEKKGVPTWYDLDQLDIGDPLLEAITKGIDKSVFVAVFLSKKSIGSRWVNQELRMAFDRIQNAEAKFLPVMLDEIPEAKLPGYLRGRLWADLKRRTDKQAEEVVDKLVRAIDRFNQSSEKDLQ